MERQWGWNPWEGAWVNPAPVKVERYMTQLGLRPGSTKRTSLYTALRDYHADPDNQQRLDMTPTIDPNLVNKELHDFLRKIGDSYFGTDSREHLTSRAPIYNPEASTEEQVETFGPLRKALLLCCQRWRQRQKRRPQETGTDAHQTLPTSEDSIASQHGNVQHSSRQHGAATESNDPPNMATRPSLTRFSSEKEVVSAVREPLTAPGVNTPESAETQTAVVLLHEEAVARKRPFYQRVIGNYAQALEARKALAESHIKGAAAGVGGSAAYMLLKEDQDAPRPKRKRSDTPPASSRETGRSFKHHDRPSSQTMSEPAQRPTPRTVRVQLCIRNSRDAYVEWPHGRMSTHTVQTLLEKFAECSRLRREPEHVNFFLADAKRKREFGIARGDEAKFEETKERIGIIVSEERHKGDFQVHMDAEVKVESDEEVVVDI